MTNKQQAIIDKLIEIFTADSQIKYAGIYPDDVVTIGNRKPAVIVIDDDESDYKYKGMSVEYSYNIGLLLVMDKVEGNRIKDLLAMQNHIQTLIAINDNALASVGCSWVHLISVDKGNLVSQQSEDSLGYLGSLSTRKINIQVGINDALASET